MKQRRNDHELERLRFREKKHAEQFQVSSQDVTDHLSHTQNREYLTEGNDKLEDRDEYIRRSLEGTIQLCATGVASLKTKTTELPPEYQAYADIFDPNGSKRLPPYREVIAHSIELMLDAKLPRRRCYSYSDRELKAMKEWIDGWSWVQ